MSRSLFLTLSIVTFSIAHANHHEHCHKQKGIGRMFFDGSIQLVENNAYILSAAGAVAFLYSPLLKRRLNETETFATAVGIWLGGGMITRSIARTIMAQADIKRL